MADAIRESFGRLDILLLNASGGLEKDKPASYAMELNLTAQVRMLDAMLPMMAAGGCIVFVTSHLAHFYGRKPVYAAYEGLPRARGRRGCAALENARIRGARPAPGDRKRRHDRRDDYAELLDSARSRRVDKSSPSAGSAGAADDWQEFCPSAAAADSSRPTMDFSIQPPPRPLRCRAASA